MDVLRIGPNSGDDQSTGHVGEVGGCRLLADEFFLFLLNGGSVDESITYKQRRACMYMQCKPCISSRQL